MEDLSLSARRIFLKGARILPLRKTANCHIPGNKKPPSPQYAEMVVLFLDLYNCFTQQPDQKGSGLEQDRDP